MIISGSRNTDKKNSLSHGLVPDSCHIFKDGPLIVQFIGPQILCQDFILLSLVLLTICFYVFTFCNNVSLTFSFIILVKNFVSFALIF